VRLSKIILSGAVILVIIFGGNSLFAQFATTSTAQKSLQQTGNQKNAPSSSSSCEPRDSFSQLTLFLFASGLALFAALLGWSDQIRGIYKDTRELERRFLEDTGIEKRDFLCIVKPQSPEKQLEAVTQISGKIKSRSTVDLLRTFNKWNDEWSRLEKLSVWKYNLTVTLTVTLFIAGIASLFTSPSQSMRLHFITFRSEMLILLLPMSLISWLLGIIIDSARREKALRRLLNSIADMV